MGANDMPRLLTYQQAADLSGIPEKWLRRAAISELIPRAKFGHRTVRIDSADLPEIIRTYKTVARPTVNTRLGRPAGSSKAA